MINDEDIKYFASVHAGGPIGEMATELLAYREEKRKAEEDRAKSWKSLPKWAQWKATDRDGVVFLHENKPIPYMDEWLPPPAGGRVMKYVGPVRGWKATLETRP